MKTYILSRETFYKIKPELDQAVLWRPSGNDIEVRLVFKFARTLIERTIKEKI